MIEISIPLSAIPPDLVLSLASCIVGVFFIVIGCYIGPFSKGRSNPFIVCGGIVIVLGVGVGVTWLINYGLQLTGPVVSNFISVYCTSHPDSCRAPEIPISIKFT